jgi:abnormal spindle-like microcephaly-associated protein
LRALVLNTAALCLPVQVVSDFLQSRLVGEGNVLRHLELLGYRLSYSQGALMEYPFAITNLAVDLRDGLRLIKVAEVLTGGPHWLCRVWFFQGAVLSA